MKQNWEYKKLGEVCESDLGKTLNQSKDTGNLQPYLCSVNIQWDGIDLTTIKQAKFEDDEIDRYSVKEGDLLICEGGDVGRAAIWKGKPMLYQNALHRVRFNESVIARFALLYLRHLKTIGDIDTKYSRGVTIKHLVKTSLNSIPIPVPPLSTQTAIVSELDALSAIIADHKSLLKKYDELEQSIFYDMFGDPVKNDKGWEVKKLGEIVIKTSLGLIKSGNEQNTDHTYLYFKMNNIGDNGHVDLSKVTRIEANEQELIKYSLNEGDFLFNTRNSFELVGKTCVYRKIEDYVIYNNNIMKFQFMEGVSTIFLNMLFQDYYIKKQLDSIKKGTTSVWAIYYKDLKNIDILFPPEELQQVFALKIEAIESMKADTKKSLAKSEELFNARMDYYFNA